MDAVLPWKVFLSELEPFYPKGAKGRPPVGLEAMLRAFGSGHGRRPARQFGTDTQGYVHSVEVTAANVHDVTMMEQCLHGEEKEIYGDKGYACRKRKEKAESQGVAWRVLRKLETTGLPVLRSEGPSFSLGRVPALMTLAQEQPAMSPTLSSCSLNRMLSSGKELPRQACRFLTAWLPDTARKH